MSGAAKSYRVACPACHAHLQLSLPLGIWHFQCCQCSSIFQLSRFEETLDECLPHRNEHSSGQVNVDVGSFGNGNRNQISFESSQHLEGSRFAHRENVLQKRRKDPNAPKLAMTAYVLYSNAYREQVKRDHPDWNLMETTKYLGEMWRKTSDAERSKYEHLARDDRDRYQRELANYQASTSINGPPLICHPVSKGAQGTGQQQRPKRKRAEGLPKQVVSAYFFFSRDNREKVHRDHPEANSREQSRILGELWKELSARDREKYEKLALEDKERYTREMDEYRSTQRGKKTATRPVTDPLNDVGPLKHFEILPNARTDVKVKVSRGE